MAKISVRILLFLCRVERRLNGLPLQGGVFAGCVWGKQNQLPEETEMKNWDLALPWIIHLIWHPGSGPG